MFDKISSLIKEKSLKSSQCVYHTLRLLDNGGKIRVLVLPDRIARAEYVCPKCGQYGFAEAEWKRPFSVKCEKCGATIKVPKLKGKKEK
ncbi:MAG: hypothetical protein KKB25_03415 [Nanoarchaeota archaeon]|nr:hypothetical protein [Nanoarchaeota archaeon]